MRVRTIFSIAVFVSACAFAATTPKPAYDEKTFNGLELREIGPAMTSGRIADLAVDAHDPRTWFVASASGGVWKTTNAGTTFTPVFDGEGSFLKASEKMLDEHMGFLVLSIKA
jgi:photosystem II stability/assembly factor-like uncharacterized protein